MRLPGLGIITDKWVLIGLAAGAGVYWFTNQHHGYGAIDKSVSRIDYDRPGLYEVPAPERDFTHMRFSGQAELQRRLTVV